MDRCRMTELNTELLRERFTSPWWHTAIRPDVDDELNCGTRRQTLRDALDGYDDEETE